MVQAFFDGYAGMELELPSGELVKVQPLPLAQAAHWLRLWEQARGTKETPGDPAIKYRIIEEFPKAVGLEAALNRCTLEEFWEVFDCFFGRRIRRNGAPQTSTAPSSPGTIS